MPFLMLTTPSGMEVAGVIGVIKKHNTSVNFLERKKINQKAKDFP